nr:hypothetical protein B0A51_11664 [Rachicladosporium sp. CCFEE 5018]
MGWFWADASPARATAQAIAPHPIPTNGAEPPPGCPMHKSSATAAPSSPPPPPSASQSFTQAATSTTQSSTAPSPPPPETPSYISKLNPLNYMPASIANTREHEDQTVNLPLSREPSTIPRGDGEGTWQYPSPQQMYNALLRKGYTDTPAEHVEEMVAVHNFLNEGAWNEVKEWERRFSGGLAKGWEACRRGEGGAQTWRRGADDEEEPSLLRFMGRPGDMTPKARMLAFMAKVYPSQFPNNPPFDRHDWFVERRTRAGEKREVRYVIDYYSGPPEPTGEPVFYLDVRPAVDGPTAAVERAMRWGGDVWYRASGASVREELAKREQRR